MEVLAIVPARGGSKGIPGKNIKDLAGHPLIYYSIKAGQESKYVTRTVLSTEDETIKKIAQSVCNCEVIDRPKGLALDETKTIPVLIQVCDFLKKVMNRMLLFCCSLQHRQGMQRCWMKRLKCF